VQRIEGDRALRDIELAKQLLYGRDLVGFFVDIDVRQDQARSGIERVQHLGCFAVSEIMVRRGKSWVI
jgi:hypothetical protein